MKLEEGKDYEFTGNTLYMIDGGARKEITIDYFRMEEVISSGANGVTIKGYNETAELYAVIKVWKPRTTDMARYELQYKSEIRKMASVRTPEVVKIYFGDVINGYGVAVMDFIDGEPLKEWIKHNTDPNRRIELAQKILGAVESYQKQGVLHGDLHGGNILVTEDDEIHIIDFGTSKLTREERSKDRECYLVYETISKLLEVVDGYNEEHFSFGVNKHNVCLDWHSSLRVSKGIEPMLLTKTLIAYTDVLELMSNIKNLNRQDSIQIAQSIANTRYLNMVGILNDVLERLVEEEQRIFMRVFAENVEMSMFPDGYLDEEYYYENLDIISVYVYYEVARANKRKIIYEFSNVKMDKESAAEACKRLNQWLMNTKDTFFDVFEENIDWFNVGWIETIRSLLYYSLLEWKKPEEWLFYLYDLNTELDLAVNNPIVRERMEKVKYALRAM